MMEAEREQLTMLSRESTTTHDRLPGAASRLTGSALRAAAELITGTQAGHVTPAPSSRCDQMDEGLTAAGAELDCRWQLDVLAAVPPAIAIGKQAAEMARREAAARLTGFDEM